MSKKFLKIHPDDNVLVALADLRAGEPISNGLTAVHDVPAKHKIVIRDLKPGEPIKMYGITVGKTVAPIAAGAAITTQNVKHEASPYSGRTATLSWTAPDVSRWKNKTFDGYHRPDGQVGVANYWVVVPLVFCENKNVEAIRDAFEEGLGFAKNDAYKNFVNELVQLYKAGNLDAVSRASLRNGVDDSRQRIFENIDGIRFLTHEGGCGGTRQDSEALCRLIAGYIHNPNVAGATVLSLGCQNAQVQLLKDKLAEKNFDARKPLIIVEQQKSGTEQEMLETAIRETFIGLAEANQLERKPAPLNKLVVGLECGGSDGFSGISANPAIGHTSDLLVALKATTMLSEFPELCGVEQELINRSIDDNTAARFMELMRAYERAAVASGSGFDMNPSPGNIRDGLITDAMKSAGAAKKGGTSPVTDVLDYGEYVRRPGLNLLCTPGNDVESTTAMAGAGATIILFTTGLGTPTGNPIAPVIKVSSNSKTASRMSDIIDVDAGPIISGESTIEEMGEKILEFVIEVASGRRKTKADTLHQTDFIPWKRGVSL